MLRGMRALGSVCAKTVVAVGLAAQAGAAPITGGIGFGGGIAPTDFATTNSIDIVDNLAAILCFSGTNGEACTGDYASLNSATPGMTTYNDFTFNPLAGGIAPLWIFTRGSVTYSFNLQAITSISRTPAGISLTGFGIARVTGRDDTFATWSFSANTAAQIYRFTSTMGTTPSSQTEVDLIFADGFDSGG